MDDESIAGGPALEAAGGDEATDVVADWRVIPAMKDATRISVWRRLIAALVYDSQVHPRVVGTRAVSAVASRYHRLMYEVGDVEIDLEVRPSKMAGRLRVLGQVMASGPNLVKACVIVEGASVRLATEVDDLGQFSLDGLVSGAHRMEIALAYELIEIPSVRL